METNNLNEKSKLITNSKFSPEKILKYLIFSLPSLTGGSFWFGWHVGNTKYDSQKIELAENNTKYKDTLTHLKVQITKLKDDSIKGAHYMEKDAFYFANSNKSSDKIKNKRHQFDKPTTSDIPIQKKSDEDYWNNEINILKKDKKELESKLKLISSEKVDLKRKIQSYMSMQDSIINEMEILHDQLKITEGKAREDTQIAIKELLIKSRDSKVRFNETDDGKEFAKEMEKDSKELADAKAKIHKLEQTVENADGKESDAYYKSGINALKEIKGLFVIFGINHTQKCNLIKGIKSNFEEAQKLGKDCSSEIDQLEKDFSQYLK